MRNLSVIFLAVILLASCKEKPSYTLFGHKMEREKGGRIFKADQRFLTICSLQNLYDVWIPAVKTGDNVKKVLSSVLPADFPLHEIATVMLYTLQHDTSKWEIALDQTPAMSIIRVHDNGYYHDYLERKDKKFEIIPQFSSAVNGGLSSDDIRMLHFASSSSVNLPAATTIYQLRLLPTQMPPVSGEPNLGIGNTLLMDMKRNNGMLTFDLYGDEFYKVMLRDNDGGSGSGHCGNSTTCPPGSTSCIPPPADRLDQEYPGTCAARGGGCCNAVLVAARQASADGKVGFNLKDMFEYRDKFLLTYELGRRYYAYFCLVGRYMKMSPGAVKNYIEVVNVLQKIMEKLKGADDNVVVFDDEFAAVFTTFISNHANSGVKELDAAMAAMSNDLKQNKGMTKAQLLRLFEESNKSKS